MTAWEDVSLGDVADALVGFAFKSSRFSDDPSDIRLVRGVNIGQGFLDWTRTAYWPAEDRERYARYELADGDVLLAMDRPWVEAGLKRARIGSRALPALLVQRVTRLRGTKRVRTSFLHHLLAGQSFSDYISPIVTGVNVPHISPAQIAAFRFRLPSLPEQDAICYVLDTIDDLIENSRRRIVLLEQMAQEIYREWFVHLRYPGRTDEELIDSPLGLIPADWEVRTVEEVAAVVRGRSYRKRELVEEGGVPFINLKCMARGGGFRRDGLKRYAGPFKPEQVASAGDIVLAVTDLTQSREILARATLVPTMPEGSGVISLDVVRLIPRSAGERIPLFAVLRHSDLADRVKEHANGATVLHLSPDHVAAAPIIWPGEPVRRRAADVLGSIYSLGDELSNAADRLAGIRDTLGPKLVTGAINVSQFDLGRLLEESAG